LFSEGLDFPQGTITTIPAFFLLLLFSFFFSKITLVKIVQQQQEQANLALVVFLSPSKQNFQSVFLFCFVKYFVSSVCHEILFKEICVVCESLSCRFTPISQKKKQKKREIFNTFNTFFAFLFVGYGKFCCCMKA
jgi:hypothetical protein